MMKLKKNVLITAVFVGIFTMTAWANNSSERVKDRVLKGFMSYYDSGIEEKLYLQTDKPYYSAGEHIWIKGYLCNAITHAPLEFTNFIYVELLDSEGGLVSRVKIKRTKRGFNGYILLDAKMTPGDYILRGYTQWMRNNDEDFFFRKQLKIVSPIPIDAQKNIIGAQTPKTEKQKRVDAKQSDVQQVLDYDVQFFPEGGHLLENIQQTVAFKAVAEDGLSLEISGTIYNSKGEEITDFKSSHKGMGWFSMIPQPTEKYYAKVRASNGREKQFDLPATDVEGAVLKVSRIGNKIFYNVQSSSDELVKGAFVVIHSRGRIINITPTANKATGFLPASNLYDGISVFSLMTNDYKIISERVFFKRPINSPVIKIKSGMENYAARSMARVRVRVTDTNGRPIRGEFGISVTDNSSVDLDAATENMVSYLLLSSEIKGYIEDPTYYFIDDDRQRDADLDLLMMTQGWRRFDLQKVISGTSKPRTFAYETGSVINGEVKGFFGNAARRPSIFVLCPKLKYVDMFSLDNTNRFRLVDLDMPDSAEYLIQAQGRNGGQLVTLNVEDETFPSLNVRLAKRAMVMDTVPTSFVNQSQEKFYYEGGMKVIELEAVGVSAARIEASKHGIAATRSTDRKRLEQMQGWRLENIIMTYPSMRIVDYEMGGSSESSGGSSGAEGSSGEEGSESNSSSSVRVVYRGGPSAVNFIIDGIEYEYEDVRGYMAEDIEQLDFFSGPEAAMFNNSSGGVFYITLREGALNSQMPPRPNIARVKHLGYQKPYKLYQPKYNNPKVKETAPPDYRTTLYWNGEARTDSTGHITFNFFTADKPTTYTISVEGLSNTGEICRGSAAIKRTLAY